MIVSYKYISETVYLFGKTAKIHSIGLQDPSTVIVEYPNGQRQVVTDEVLLQTGNIERLRRKYFPDALERFAEGMANAERNKR